jgi:hypothetical protein
MVDNDEPDSQWLIKFLDSEKKQEEAAALAIASMSQKEPRKKKEGAEPPQPGPGPTFAGPSGAPTAARKRSVGGAAKPGEKTRRRSSGKAPTDLEMKAGRVAATESEHARAVEHEERAEEDEGKKREKRAPSVGDKPKAKKMSRAESVEAKEHKAGVAGRKKSVDTKEEPAEKRAAVKEAKGVKEAHPAPAKHAPPAAKRKASDKKPGVEGVAHEDMAAVEEGESAMELDLAPEKREEREKAKRARLQKEREEGGLLRETEGWLQRETEEGWLQRETKAGWLPREMEEEPVPAPVRMDISQSEIDLMNEKEREEFIKRRQEAQVAVRTKALSVMGSVDREEGLAAMAPEEREALENLEKHLAAMTPEERQKHDQLVWLAEGGYINLQASDMDERKVIRPTPRRTTKADTLEADLTEAEREARWAKMDDQLTRAGEERDDVSARDDRGMRQADPMYRYLMSEDERIKADEGAEVEQEEGRAPRSSIHRAEFDRREDWDSGEEEEPRERDRHAREDETVEKGKRGPKRHARPTTPTGGKYYEAVIRPTETELIERDIVMKGKGKAKAQPRARKPTTTQGMEDERQRSPSASSEVRQPDAKGFIDRKRLDERRATGSSASLAGYEELPFKGKKPSALSLELLHVQKDQGLCAEHSAKLTTGELTTQGLEEMVENCQLTPAEMDSIVKRQLIVEKMLGQVEKGELTESHLAQMVKQGLISRNEVSAIMETLYVNDMNNKLKEGKVTPKQLNEMVARGEITEDVLNRIMKPPQTMNDAMRNKALRGDLDETRLDNLLKAGCITNEELRQGVLMRQVVLEQLAADVCSGNLGLASMARLMANGNLLELVEKGEVTNEHMEAIINRQMSVEHLLQQYNDGVVDEDELENMMEKGVITKKEYNVIIEAINVNHLRGSMLAGKLTEAQLDDMVKNGTITADMRDDVLSPPIKMLDVIRNKVTLGEISDTKMRELEAKGILSKKDVDDGMNKRKEYLNKLARQLSIGELSHQNLVRLVCSNQLNCTELALITARRTITADEMARAVARGFVTAEQILQLVLSGHIDKNDMKNLVTRSRESAINLMEAGMISEAQYAHHLQLTSRLAKTFQQMETARWEEEKYLERFRDYKTKVVLADLPANASQMLIRARMAEMEKQLMKELRRRDKMAQIKLHASRSSEIVVASPSESAMMLKSEPKKEEEVPAQVQEIRRLMSEANSMLAPPEPVDRRMAMSELEKIVEMLAKPLVEYSRETLSELASIREAWRGKPATPPPEPDVLDTFLAPHKPPPKMDLRRGSLGFALLKRRSLFEKRTQAEEDVELEVTRPPRAPVKILKKKEEPAPPLTKMVSDYRVRMMNNLLFGVESSDKVKRYSMTPLSLKVFDLSEPEPLPPLGKLRFRPASKDTRPGMQAEESRGALPGPSRIPPGFTMPPLKLLDALPKVKSKPKMIDEERALTPMGFPVKRDSRTYAPVDAFPQRSPPRVRGICMQDYGRQRLSEDYSRPFKPKSGRLIQGPTVSGSFIHMGDEDAADKRMSMVYEMPPKVGKKRSSQTPKDVLLPIIQHNKNLRMPQIDHLGGEKVTGAPLKIPREQAHDVPSTSRDRSRDRMASPTRPLVTPRAMCAPKRYDFAEAAAMFDQDEQLLKLREAAHNADPFHRPFANVKKGQPFQTQPRLPRGDSRLVPLQPPATLRPPSPLGSRGAPPLRIPFKADHTPLTDQMDWTRVRRGLPSTRTRVRVMNRALWHTRTDAYEPETDGPLVPLDPMVVYGSHLTHQPEAHTRVRLGERQSPAWGQPPRDLSCLRVTDGNGVVRKFYTGMAAYANAEAVRLLSPPYRSMDRSIEASHCLPSTPPGSRPEWVLRGQGLGRGRPLPPGAGRAHLNQMRSDLREAYPMQYLPRPLGGTHSVVLQLAYGLAVFYILPMVWLCCSTACPWFGCVGLLHNTLVRIQFHLWCFCDV